VGIRTIPAIASRRALGAILPLTCLFVAPDASADTAPIWTGVYAGVQGGVTWAELDIDQFGKFDSQGSVWGLHAGFNVAKGSVVIGIEGDVNFDGADVEGSIPGLGRFAAETQWSGSLRLRAGMIVGPALIYATVGYAHLAADLEVTSVMGDRFMHSEPLTGLVYGAGAEGFVMPNVSMRFEALRYEYSIDEDLLRPYIDPSETVLRAGLTFHLN
jgi:outer membrane immunogenic protein